jgi:hypothetical protein
MSLESYERDIEFCLDLRIIVTCGNENVDLCNGERAKKTVTKESKHYSDKLKAVLAAKQHLNAVVNSTKFLPGNTVNSIAIPVFLIMGMNCHLYTISTIDKGLYVLHKAFTMSYPVTNHEIRRGSIQTIFRGFCLVESIMQNTLDLHEEYSRSTDDDIAKMLSKKKVAEINIKDSITTVISEQEEQEERCGQYSLSCAFLFVVLN